MKGKITFFLLGAVIATIAYLAGDMTLIAENKENLKVFEGHVLIKGGLWVHETVVIGNSLDEPHIQFSTADKQSTIGLSDGHGEQSCYILIMAGEGIEDPARSEILLSQFGKQKNIKVD